MRPETVIAGPAAEAAEWFARKRSGLMTAQELCELQLWLDAAPENTGSFYDVMRAWDLAGYVGTDPEMLAIREAARGHRPARRRVMWSAGLCALVLIGGAFGAFRLGLFRDLLTPAWQGDYHTIVGQTATVALPDGSAVTLDTDTALAVRETGGRRLVEIERGQAFFRVAKDPSRPFVVSAGGNSVTATGTKFDVRYEPGGFKVTLLEGTVRVEIPPAAQGSGERADLVAGWQLADVDNHVSVEPIGFEAADRETAWLTGRISVIAEPLAAVVNELNRYSLKKIVVTPAVADIPIDGVFRTNDVEAFVKLVQRYRLARVVSDTGNEILLDAPRKKHLPAL